MQTYRSGGAGGQHVNKTESAVRMIAPPVRHRRRLPERALAAQEPLERDEDAARAPVREAGGTEQLAKMGEVHGKKKAIEWGSQIRSYVLAPYQQVNDHRTELKSSNVNGVLDGDLDEFIRAYLIMAERGPARRSSQLNRKTWTGPYTPVDNFCGPSRDAVDKL